MLSFLVLWESNVDPFCAILQCRLIPVTVFIEMQDCNLQPKKIDIFWFLFCLSFIVTYIQSGFWQPENLTFVIKVSAHYDVMICSNIHTCLSFRGMKRLAVLQQSGCRQNGRPPEKMLHVFLKFALYLSRGTPLSAAL